ncbi:MAG: N-acetylneuraminate synthase [Paenibacillaceae bacterium]
MKRNYIIAEAGVNHNGSLQLAKQLVDVATFAGADAVKFQTFKAHNLVTKDAPKANYQRSTTDQTESQFEMLKKLELSEENHVELINHCKLRGIDFLSTPFDLESVELLTQTLGLTKLKISSGEITNAPLLLKAAQSTASIILSTGMSTIEDIEKALQVIAFGYIWGNKGPIPSKNSFKEAFVSEKGQKMLKEKVTLLHCTTEYPTPFTDVNLLAMDTLKTKFSLPTGLSDHTVGIAIPIAAAARGATMIEKHFTLDRLLPGPDHLASLEPDELKQMVLSIRQVDEAMGTSFKGPAPSELSNLLIARKSIVAAKDILEGELLTVENLAIKRPGDGASPMLLWEYIGKKALRGYRIDEKVQL